MSKKTYYQRNRELILNRAKYYYENDKEISREQASDKYRNLSEEEKNKKREYGTSRYHNMSEEKKQKLKEYQKITVSLRRLNIIINEIVLIVYAIIYVTKHTGVINIHH